MRGFWLFVHFSGFMLWLGGGIAMMVAGVAAKRLAAAERLAVYRVVGSVFRIPVLWGTVGVFVSGVALLIPYMRSGAMAGWLSLMTGAGLLGGIVVLTVVVPTAARLGRLELDPRGELPEGFQALRKRQVLGASIAGGLGILALVAGTILKY